MQTYEFLAQIAANGTVTIPDDVRQHLPAKRKIKFVVSVTEINDEFGSQQSDDNLIALIAQIQATPPNPAMITPARNSLAERLQALSNQT